MSKGGFPLFCNSSYWLRLFINFFILCIFLIFHTDLHFEVSLYFLYIFCHDHKTPFFCYSVDYPSRWMNYLRKLKVCNNLISKCTIGLKYIGINTPLWSPRKGLFQDADSTFVVGLKTLFFLNMKTFPKPILELLEISNYFQSKEWKQVLPLLKTTCKNLEMSAQVKNSYMYPLNMAK